MDGRLCTVPAAACLINISHRPTSLQAMLTVCRCLTVIQFSKHLAPIKDLIVFF